MVCAKIQRQLAHYLYGELAPPQALAVMGHLERCTSCRDEFASLQRVYQALDLWEEIMPPPELRQLLLIRIARERARKPFSWREVFLGEKAVVRTMVSVACGIMAAIVSVFILTGNVLTSPLTPQTLLICGILWGGIYIALFRLALTRQRPVRPVLRWAGTTLDLTHAATLVLMALGLMVLSTVAFPLSNLTDVADVRTLFGRWLTGWPDHTLYMVFGSLVSLITLLIPTRLLGSGGTMRPVSAGLLVGCLFTVAIAPGLMILCVPFTLGLYLSALTGSAAGAVIGGGMGSWWARRAR